MKKSMASSMITLTLFLLFVLAIICHGVGGDNAKDLEFYGKLKRLQKSAIKTIKTEVGDVYDCIDIYKQPSLDHPLLQNHKIQMRPTSRPKQTYSKTLSMEAQKVNLITVDCPKGTIPVRRMERQDIVRAKSFSDSYVARTHPQTPESPGRHFAILRSKRSYAGPVFAITGVTSVHSLPGVGANHSSSSHMWMERNADSLQTGWMVSPQLNGDTLTRLFGFFKTQRNGGCFNLLCGGFIQVNQNNPIDIAINHTSTLGRDPYVIPILIFRDDKTNCWWVGTNDDVDIGYWPSGLLPDLDKNGASYVAWGGLVTGPPGVSPPMGNGRYQESDYIRVAFYDKLRIVDSTNQWVDMEADNLENYIDNDECYSIKSYYNDGLTFAYGGPGGRCGI